jgi:hypothetical protein
MSDAIHLFTQHKYGQYLVVSRHMQQALQAQYSAGAASPGVLYAQGAVVDQSTGSFRWVQQQDAASLSSTDSKPVRCWATAHILSILSFAWAMATSCSADHLTLLLPPELLCSLAFAPTLAGVYRAAVYYGSSQLSTTQPLVTVTPGPLSVPNCTLTGVVWCITSCMIACVPACVTMLSIHGIPVNCFAVHASAFGDLAAVCLTLLVGTTAHGQQTCSFGDAEEDSLCPVQVQAAPPLSQLGDPSQCWYGDETCMVTTCQACP